MERIPGEILSQITADRNSLSTTYGSQPAVVNEAKIRDVGNGKSDGQTGQDERTK